jgi:hypothetical protein
MANTTINTVTSQVANAASKAFVEVRNTVESAANTTFVETRNTVETAVTKEVSKVPVVKLVSLGLATLAVVGLLVYFFV